MTNEQAEYIGAVEVYTKYLFNSGQQDIWPKIKYTSSLAVAVTCFKEAKFTQTVGCKIMGVARGTFRTILKKAGIIKDSC
ncbi:MAG: hypothetical protein KAS32_11405 [Candidatus Peribacteraceae bacterium]|nr:hypothetical protein [Candidatus Peribacteraceae bacterium]